MMDDSVNLKSFAYFAGSLTLLRKLLTILMLKFASTLVPDGFPY